MIEWMHAEYLWALWILLPLGIAGNYFMLQRSRKINQHWPEDTAGGHRLYRRRLQWLWSLCALAALIAGIAGPRVGDEPIEKEVEERQLVFLMDISRSMWAEDISPQRITIAQSIAEQVSERVRQDRVGLIAFAGEAYMILPLTEDRASFSTFVQNTDPTTAEIQGTEIEPALRMAERTVGDLDPASVQLIILSDGENHDQGAVDYAEDLAEKGFTIHTVGIGTVEGGKIPMRNKRGLTYFKDRDGREVVTRLQSDLLKTLANKGRGLYVEFQSLYATVDQLVDAVRSLDGKTRRTTQYSSYKYYYGYAAGFALLALIATLWIQWHYRFV